MLEIKHILANYLQILIQLIKYFQKLTMSTHTQKCSKYKEGERKTRDSECFQEKRHIHNSYNKKLHTFIHLSNVYSAFTKCIA